MNKMLDSVKAFEEMQKILQDELKEIFKVCNGDIFAEQTLLQAMIISISNISIEYFEKRAKISKDAFLRLWEITTGEKRKKIAHIVKSLNLYDDIVFDDESEVENAE